MIFKALHILTKSLPFPPIWLLSPPAPFSTGLSLNPSCPYSPPLQAVSPWLMSAPLLRNVLSSSPFIQCFYFILPNSAHMKPQRSELIILSFRFPYICTCATILYYTRCNFCLLVSLPPNLAIKC